MHVLASTPCRLIPSFSMMHAKKYACNIKKTGREGPGDKASLCLASCPGSQGGGERERGTHCLHMRLIYQHSGNSVIL